MSTRDLRSVDTRSISRAGGATLPPAASQTDAGNRTDVSTSRETGTVLLVACSGGHLKQLHRLAPRLASSHERTLWVTNDTLQSRSLLNGEHVLFVPYRDSRDIPLVLVNAVKAARLFSRFRPDRVVSTGAAIALSFLPIARAWGATSHYIESGTRIHAPSLTGRILRQMPGVHCYTQNPPWDDDGWLYGGSVFEGFRIHKEPPARLAVRRIAVVLGTGSQSFRSLVDSLLPILPHGVETFWQTGSTDVSELPIEAHPWLPPERLRAALRWANVVVTHAGVGAILDALESERFPVIVPRRPGAGELIDNHQVELASELQHRGLAMARLPEDLRWDDLVESASRRVIPEPVDRLPAFLLQ